MTASIQTAFLTLTALGMTSFPGAAQDPYVVDTYVEEAAYDDAAYLVEDSLEARVWLDRGAEPVVERGDEVRVYYRTSHDAYAAIFRIDTDGRISLLYPQHPDADPYVVGARDFRLIFQEGARWSVREDPGVGYFFMVASYEPLDFSAFGYDADYGWDLRGVGETIHEDPYVAIDDYVAALLPDWETANYVLDFLEYSVGEEHDYPRFLCYDCHDYRPYSSWDPYARACSSFQVVIWDDPYFYPRFRYVGTRVVFPRPIGPRPRYSVTARLVGSGPRPIVRSRAAPPRRTTVYKEAPGRVTSVVPRRGPPTASPSGRGVAPSRSPTSRGAVSAPSSATRRQPAVSSRPSPSARRGISPAPRSGALGTAGRREPPLPSARRGIPPTGRAGASAGPTSRDRPTLQRRPAAQAPRSGGRAGASRPPPSSGRAVPSRPPRSRARPAPSRPPPPAARSGSGGGRRPGSAERRRRPGG